MRRLKRYGIQELMRATGIHLAIMLLCFPPARADFESGMYAYGMGNYEDAAREFAVLAKSGDTHAEYYLGLLYEEGQGLEQDFLLARQWYLKAAAKADVDAAFSLGRLFSNGLGVAQDLPVAYMWFGRAARGGHYLGQQEQDKCAALMTPQQLEQAKRLGKNGPP